MKRAALYVSIPDGEVRWQIKRAALEQRRTVRALVLDILVEWLRHHGYCPRGDAADGAVPECRQEG